LLRYGLPVNFQAMLLSPQKKSQKRLREVLNHLYGHLDNSAAGPAGTDVSICLFTCCVFIICPEWPDNYYAFGNVHCKPKLSFTWCESCSYLAVSVRHWTVSSVCVVEVEWFGKVKITIF